MRLLGLRAGGRLDRYVGTLFIASYATAFLLIVGLVIILDLASNLDYFEPWVTGARAPMVMILRYYVLNIPFLFLQVAPFVTVVAGLFTVSRLMKHNEVLAALGAGVSAHRLLAPILCCALVAAFAMFGVREGATVWIGLQRDALLDKLEHQRNERVFEGVWLRDRLGNLVRLGEFRPLTGSPPIAEVKDLQAIITQGPVLKVIRAESGRYVRLESGQTTWQLVDGVIEAVDDERITPTPIEFLHGIEMTPHDILVSEKARQRPLELSFRELLELARRDPDNTQYQTLLQYHLTFPLANLVLLLVALPFLMNQERGKGVEGLAVGCLLCLFYFASDFVARTMGLEGGLGPLVASWLPVLLFGSLGVVLFDALPT
jgi:lipopolysaccharide export LptBFGC system permease protein LptF